MTTQWHVPLSSGCYLNIQFRNSQLHNQQQLRELSLPGPAKVCCTAMIEIPSSGILVQLSKLHTSVTWHRIHRSILYEAWITPCSYADSRTFHHLNRCMASLRVVFSSSDWLVLLPYWESRRILLYIYVRLTTEGCTDNWYHGWCVMCMEGSSEDRKIKVIVAFSGND